MDILFLNIEKDPLLWIVGFFVTLIIVLLITTKVHYRTTWRQSVLHILDGRTSWRVLLLTAGLMLALIGILVAFANTKKAIFFFVLSMIFFGIYRFFRSYRKRA
jgi:uncharacterized membrane protein YesL